MIKAVILDWAGTVVDHGCLAPVGAFRRAFEARGMPVDEATAREPMGLAKRDHIRAVAARPDLAAAWQARVGRPFDETDVAAIFELFEPMTTAAAIQRAALIPGAAETLAWLRGRGIRVGSTTGYTRPVMEALEPLAARAGYKPEIVVCAGDLAAGRPAPLQMWHAMATMGVWPAAAVVKVDDTPVGLGEGRAAGTWAVGVALTGNLAGLDADALASLPAAERAAVRARAAAALHAGGAHLVIDGIADLPGAIAEIERLIAAGGTPD